MCDSLVTSATRFHPAERMMGSAPRRFSRVEVDAVSSRIALSGTPMRRATFASTAALSPP